MTRWIRIQHLEQLYLRLSTISFLREGCPILEVTVRSWSNIYKATIPFVSVANYISIIIYSVLLHLTRSRLPCRMDRGCSRAIASTRLTLTSGSACESEAGWRSSDGARARADPREARAASWSVWTTKVGGALFNASD